MSIDQNYTTVLSNGEEIALEPDGEFKKVKKANINEFINLVVKARFNESKLQTKAIQQGMDQVLQGRFAQITYLSPTAFEIRACGEKEISLDALKSITSYPNCEESHEIVARFWRVFESFTHEERSLYLKFVWGRNRLPVDMSKLDRKHEVRLMTDLSATGFP